MSYIKLFPRKNFTTKHQLSIRIFYHSILIKSLPLPDVYEGDGEHWDDEVERGGGQHEVHTADRLLVERNAGPIRS